MIYFRNNKKGGIDVADINIRNLQAEYWGDKEYVTRIDFRNQKVELEESGWVDFNDVNFIYSGKLEVDLEENVQRRVEEALREEREVLSSREQDLMRREFEAKLKVNQLNIKEANFTRKLVQEKQKFEEYVATTINNMNKIIDDVYRQSQVANRNEEMKKPTPDYVKYESKVFDREMMKAIEEGK